MAAWAVGTVAFLGTAFAVFALVYAFSGGNLPVMVRLTRLWRPAPEEDLSLKEKVKDQVQGALSGMGKLWPTSPKDVSRAQRLMLRAGFRRPEAVTALEGAKILVPAALLSVVYLTGAYLSNPVFFLAIAAIGGYLLPDLWLTSRIRRRQQIIRLALPDALDLLVICVEAGLALDQALIRVSQELRFAHPELCEELEIVNNEMRVGKSRLDALRDLATRTGVDDLKALVAMLIQTDRFGTSVAQSLRVHSEQLRTMRRQRAEEQAAKTTVKMVPPLVLFIFPALFVVILGPAVIAMARFFGTQH
ncbi:MAG: type II secretion system F family protein [Terriglobia bacterium]